MFDVVDVKNSNAEIFMKYYIDDTTTISNSLTKFFLRFENFSKKKSAAQTHEKEQKKKKAQRRTKVSRRRERKRKTNEFLFFV